MTTEEKQLLLIDLCARLPYKVKVLVDYIDESNVNDTLNCLHIIELKNYTGDDSLINIKPYLRPMSSMTEEELNQLKELGGNIIFYTILKKTTWSIYSDGPEVYDWLNKHHFDYRGLIPMCLALEAPEGMYSKQ